MMLRHREAPDIDLAVVKPEVIANRFFGNFDVLGSPVSVNSILTSMEVD